MTTWRSFAKAGLWRHIQLSHEEDHDGREGSVPKADWPELREVLQSVLPLVERQDGIELRHVHADPDNRLALGKHVGDWEYEKAMRRLELRYSDVAGAELTVLETRRRKRSEATDRNRLLVEDLAFAAALLADLKALLGDQDKTWPELAEDVANGALGRAGIVYLGLRETRVVRDEKSGEWRAADNGDGLPLEDLADLDSAEMFSEVWHAAMLLSQIAEYQRMVGLVMRPGLYRPGKKTVVEHMDHAASTAFEIGRHLQAIWNKPFEPHALRGMKVREGQQVGAAMRRAETKQQSDAVIAEMRRLIGNGKLSVSNAARIAFRNGEGSSEKANLRLWYRRKRP
jgi:hypothetical protein